MQYSNYLTEDKIDRAIGSQVGERYGNYSNSSLVCTAAAVFRLFFKDKIELEKEKLKLEKQKLAAKLLDIYQRNYHGAPHDAAMKEMLSRYNKLLASLDKE